jgi:hypothetical protein
MTEVTNLEPVLINASAPSEGQAQEQQGFPKQILNTSSLNLLNSLFGPGYIASKLFVLSIPVVLYQAGVINLGKVEDEEKSDLDLASEKISKEILNPPSPFKTSPVKHLPVPVKVPEPTITPVLIEKKEEPIVPTPVEKKEEPIVPTPLEKNEEPIVPTPVEKNEEPAKPNKEKLFFKEEIKEKIFPVAYLNSISKRTVSFSAPFQKGNLIELLSSSEPTKLEIKDSKSALLGTAYLYPEENSRSSYVFVNFNSIKNPDAAKALAALSELGQSQVFLENQNLSLVFPPTFLKIAKKREDIKTNKIYDLSSPSKAFLINWLKGIDFSKLKYDMKKKTYFQLINLSSNNPLLECLVEKTKKSYNLKVNLLFTKNLHLSLANDIAIELGSKPSVGSVNLYIAGKSY